MKLIIIYDDSAKATGRNKTILGERTYGDMVLKRESMFSRMRKIVKANKNVEIMRIKNFDDFDPSGLPMDVIYVHILASSAVILPEDFNLMLEKVLYTKEDLAIRDQNKIHGGVFKNRTNYEKFLGEYKNQGTLNFLKGDAIEANSFIDLTNYNTLLMFISSGFDARYFNSLVGDAYTVTKRSADKKKMKMEYTYYWLLPESMKSWMVMPYNYQETATDASYTMERMPMTDIAIRWTHGAVNSEELENILDRTFYFLGHRAEKKITKEEYQKAADKLYFEKVIDRIKTLKTLPEYKELERLISVGTKYKTIDEIVEEYTKLYKKVMKIKKLAPVSVIGHGDVFFANMLYSKELNLLRLIDPKGALTEEDLWMDPYYDVAKLSHSICGNYDFFNVGAYSIDYGKSMQFELTVHNDNTKAKEIFQKYLKKNGYDYVLVRVYETSLFLSMLPLHIDNPHKVFGFLLNAINIMEEVEEYV